MHIHVAVVRVFQPFVLLQSRPSCRAIPFCRRCKARRQGLPNPVEFLMLRKDRVPNSVNHSKQCQGDSTDNKQSPRRAHRFSPSPRDSDASISPVQRTIPIHIASSARITRSPPTSAIPPASSPSLSSSNTNTGSKSEPSKNTQAQLCFHESRNLT